MPTIDSDDRSISMTSSSASVGRARFGAYFYFIEMLINGFQYYYKSVAIGTYCSGWTQGEIGNVVGVGQHRVGEILVEMTKSSKPLESLKEILGWT